MSSEHERSALRLHRIDVVVKAPHFLPRFLRELLARIEAGIKPEEVVPEPRRWQVRALAPRPRAGDRNGTVQCERVLVLSYCKPEIAGHEPARLPDSRDYLFCDTSPLTTAVYSRLMFGHVPPELAVLAQRSYDLLVYCTPDFPFVQDGTRRDADFRAKQDALTRGEIERLGGASLRVEGPIEARMQRVLDWLRDRGAGVLDVDGAASSASSRSRSRTSRA